MEPIAFGQKSVRETQVTLALHFPLSNLKARRNSSHQQKFIAHSQSELGPLLDGFILFLQPLLAKFVEDDFLLKN